MRRPAFFLGAVVVALWFPGAASGQRGLSIGAKAGLSVARVYGAGAQQLDAGYGFTGGVFASAGLSDRLGLEVDAVYAQKHSTMTVTGSVNGTITYRFNYVEVPLLVRYTVWPRARLAPMLVLGVAPAFRLNSTRTSGSWTGPPGTFPTQFVFPKSVDVGLLFGATIGLPTGRHRGRLDARYTLGVTRFAGRQFTGTGYVEDPAVDLKNSALTVTAAYAFNIVPRLFTKTDAFRSPGPVRQFSN